jgi:hypothetical protein
MSNDVSEVSAASIIRTMIALMMEAARTSETSVDIQLRTRQYIPEDSEPHMNMSFPYDFSYNFNYFSFLPLQINLQAHT